MKIGVIGDAHFKDYLSYADYINDRRESEKEKIFNFIVETFQDCEVIVLLGDNFNSKNNSSKTNREFIEFLESFGPKDIFIISGNHEKKGDGSTAIDFIGAIENKVHWHIFTKPSSFPLFGGKIKADFLPYMLNSELGVENYEEATKDIINHLDGGSILFTHHAISGTSFNGIKTDDLHEVVLPKEELEKKYKLIVGGHIHAPQKYGNVLIAGSLFTSEVGETEKFIYKISEDLTIEKFPIPARPIFKLHNPTADKLLSIPNNAILKVIITNKTVDIEELKKHLSRFDAYLLIEDYPNERKKMHIEQGAFDFGIESLLKLYSDAKGVDYAKLLKGLQLVENAK